MFNINIKLIKALIKFDQQLQEGSSTGSGFDILKLSWSKVCSSILDLFDSTSCIAISVNISSTPLPVLHEVLYVVLMRLWHCSLKHTKVQ